MPSVVTSDKILKVFADFVEDDWQAKKMIVLQYSNSGSYILLYQESPVSFLVYVRDLRGAVCPSHYIKMF